MTRHSRRRSIIDDLARLSKTFDDKDTGYGESWVVVGRVLKDILPKGMRLETPTDFMEMGVLTRLVGNVCRIVHTRFDEDVAEDSRYDRLLDDAVDSLSDIALYALMWKSLITQGGDEGSVESVVSLGDREVAEAGRSRRHYD